MTLTDDRGHEGREPPTAAGDPSLGVLRAITDSALDPGYEAAARRRSSGPAGPATAPRRTVGLLLLLGIIGLLIGGAIALRRDAASGAVERDALRQRVDAALVASDAQEQRVAALRAEVDALRARAGEPGEGPSTALQVTTGAVPVTGPGVRIELEDAAADQRRGSDPRLGRVLDVDLQGVVNGLWAAGAEAVAVNGQRITSLSAVRGAGEAILVNYRPLVPPYRVEAVGDPRILQSFTDGPAGRALQAAVDGYGLRVRTGTEESLELPAGPTRVSIAVPVPATSAAGAP